MLPAHFTLEEEADQATVPMIPRNSTHTPMIRPSYHIHTISCQHEQGAQRSNKTWRRTNGEKTVAREPACTCRDTNARLALGRYGKEYWNWLTTACFETVTSVRQMFSCLLVEGSFFWFLLFYSIIVTCLLPFPTYMISFYVLSVQARMQRGMKIHDAQRLFFFKLQMSSTSHISGASGVLD